MTNPDKPVTDPSTQTSRLEQVGARLTTAVEASEASATHWLQSRPRLAALVTTIAGVVVKQSYYRLSLSAAGAAFWLVIAVFPAVFAGIMIFGLVVSQDQITSWLNRASGFSSNGLASVVAEQAQQVVQTEPSTLSLGLGISLALTLWSASAGSYALLRSLRMAYGLAPQSYVVARARGVLATLIAVLGLGLLAWLGVRARDFVSDRDGLIQLLAGTLGAALLLVFVTAAVAATFRFAIAAPTPWRCVLPGAVLTTLTIALLAAGLALFGNFVSRFQATYGALTSVVVTLFVLYGLMYATLLAALFNALWVPLPAAEDADAETPNEQWRRLSAELTDRTSSADATTNTMEPPSDTLP